MVKISRVLILGASRFYKCCLYYICKVFLFSFVFCLCSAGSFIVQGFLKDVDGFGVFQVFFRWHFPLFQVFDVFLEECVVFCETVFLGGVRVFFSNGF